MEYLSNSDIFIAVTGGVTAVIVEVIKWIRERYGVIITPMQMQISVALLALAASAVYAATPTDILVEAVKIIATAIGVYEILIKNIYRYTQGNS